jgi:hypothetical protein
MTTTTSDATVPRKLVTLVAPESAEDFLTDEITSLGFGLSVIGVRGKGKHGHRPDPWHGANIEVRTVMDEAGVAALFLRLAPKLATTDILAWVSDVQAWPAARFPG